MKATELWLERHGFPQLEVTAVKPSAVALVDDRAVTYSGDWDAVLAGITALRNRRRT